MTSPEFCPFDGGTLNGSPVGPYRPDVDDVGGCEWIDDQEHPPIPKQMITADDMNRTGELTVRACRMVAALKMYLTHSVGVSPELVGFACVNNAIVSGSFTISNPATGVIGIRWPVGSLPPRRVGPIATPSDSLAVSASVTQTANTVYVQTFDASGDPIDSPFTVEIDGE
jgi:hypothetical protein